MSEKTAQPEKAITPSQALAAVPPKKPVVAAIESATRPPVAAPSAQPPVNMPVSSNPPKPTTPQLAAKPVRPPRPGNEVDDMLIYILSQPRGHGGKNELKFGHWLVAKIKSFGFKSEIMAEGAIFVRVGEPKDSKTLFSCHIDSVHSVNEEEPQKLVYDSEFQHIMLEKPAKIVGAVDPTWVSGIGKRTGSCLGADDGAGVWLMLKMIEAKVPGGYMFHRGEERGCISSAAMAMREQKWLSQWSAAIAFDRPKDHEVITHQGGVRCASDTYAQALADALSSDKDNSLCFNISDRGGTTDTRQYRFLIPECINVAVGYYDHHTDNEYLDWGHLEDLMNRCIKIEWEKLPVSRDPKSYDTGYGGARGSYGGYGSYTGSNSPNARGAGHGAAGAASKPSAPPPPAPAPKSKAPEAGTTLEVLYGEATCVEDIEMWFEMDPKLTARCILQALIEGRAAQIQYQMLLRKTLKR